jgi:hyperosmotically inducible protein
MKNCKLNVIATALMAALPLAASHALAQTSDAPQQSTQSPSQMPAPGMQSDARMDDAAITSKVKAAIKADPQLTALKVNVKTKQGVVMVSGTVPNAELNSHLLQVVSSVSGVRDVQNQLKIKEAS